MNTTAIVLALFVAPQGGVQANTQAEVQGATQSITAREVHAHIEFLAQESLEGRSAGKRGGLLGRQYVAAQFKRIGLQPPNGSGQGIVAAEAYFQPFPQVKGASNVVGILPGTDLRGEAVVLGAHLDHLGVNADGDAYNGADDNASGTCAIIEIAEAMVRLQPRRTVIFVGFDAEEMGLIGSGYYAAHPVTPMQNTVAMLNLDMIARNAANYIAAVGTFRTPELQRIIRKANQEIGLDISFEPGAYFRSSDHYPFAVKGIPVVHFFSGLHTDYHGINDTADKVDTDKIEKVARLCFLTAWTLATEDSRPQVELTETEVRALAQLDTPKLIEKSHSDNSLLRYLAVQNLTRRPGENVYAALVAALRDQEDFVKRAAVRALGFRGEARAGELIVPFLDSKDSALRSDAVSAAGRLKAKAAVPALIRLAGKGQRGAVRALGDIGGDDALDAVRAAYKNPKQRAEAVSALARLRAFDDLAKGLKDSSEQVRLLSARAFRRAARAQPPIDALFAAMADESSTVRAAVAEALVRSGDKRVRGVMEKALADPAFAVRLVAARSLLPHDSAADVLMRDFQKAKPFPRASIARALGAARSEKALSFLAKVRQTDPIARVRRYAVSSLAKSNDEMATKALREALSDKAADVRSAAAGALLRRGEPGALAVLRDIALGDGGRYVRQQAVRQLAQGKGPQVVDILMRCLDKKDLRMAALQNLERVTGERMGFNYRMGSKQMDELAKKWREWHQEQKKLK
ncbi:MAG: M28 family peptidase [Planctomycetota bacterium]|jgi:HEAT repeat protein